MSVAFAVLCIFTALLMIILLKIDIDIQYRAGFTVTLHINILAVELNQQNGKKKNKNKGGEKKPSSKNPIRRAFAYIDFTSSLMQNSYISLNAVSLPDIIPTDFMGEYIKCASYSVIISIFCAYLDSNSLKLTEKAGAYGDSSQKLLLDVSLTTRVLHVLKSLIVLKRRLREIEKEQA